MIELHVRLEIIEGKGPDLEAVYRGDFLPVISRREGFRQVRLLRKRDAPGEYELDIAFSSEALRLKWVDSPEHAAVWPRIAGLCQRFSGTGFDACAPEI
jgi:heme-degrading monooxygenase HmoA